MRTELAEDLVRTIIKRYPKADEYPYRPWSYPQGFRKIL